MLKRLTFLIPLALLAIALFGFQDATARRGGQPQSPRLFSPASAGPLEVGDAPSALATLDMKGDAFDEVLVASAGKNRVEVLSNRNGHLSVTSRHLVDPSPTAIGTDGGDDVLVVSARSDQAQTFYNDYFRTYVNVLAPGKRVQVGADPSAALSVAMSIQTFSPEGRLKNVGSVDWVVASRGSDDLYLIESSPSGKSLAVVSAVPVGDKPTAMVADPSGSDFYVANSGSGTITEATGGILNGVLSTKTIPVGGEPVALGMANLIPGDHNEEEIAVVDRARDQVEILVRAYPVPFQPRDVYHVAARYSVGNGPVGLVIANLDERLGADIAVVNSLSEDVSILRNTGSGRFVPGGTIPVGRHPVAIVPVAYGRYYAPDLVVANRGSDDLTVLVRKEHGRCGGRTAKLRLGTPDRDILGSDDGRDETKGLDGDDLISGGGDVDCLRGEGGDDSLTGNGDDDLIWPGLGKDRVEGGSGDDKIFAKGDGTDLIKCGPGDDTAYADSSDSTHGCEHTP
ncbi:MAG TPA: hypothetical protein VIE64_03215 [Solirubrobacterales bacterium]|jgi:Ca2+-binding RTX toxin-like protein